eukprot:1782821-Pyramimonas_sp.AAC.2
MGSLEARKGPNGRAPHSPHALPHLPDLHVDEHVARGDLLPAEDLVKEDVGDVDDGRPPELPVVPSDALRAIAHCAPEEHPCIVAQDDFSLREPRGSTRGSRDLPLEQCLCSPQHVRPLEARDLELELGRQVIGGFRVRAPHSGCCSQTAAGPEHLRGASLLGRVHGSMAQDAHAQHFVKVPVGQRVSRSEEGARGARGHVGDPAAHVAGEHLPGERDELPNALSLFSCEE